MWAGIGALVLIVLGWWLVSKNASPEAVIQNESEVAGESEKTDYLDNSKDSATIDAFADPTLAVTVRYIDNGFSPKTITIKKGTRVTFVDENAKEDMWVGADEHPTHTEYDGTSKNEHCIEGKPSTTTFDQCGKGATYSFTFDKVGTWGYHNHVVASDEGTVIVTE